MVNTIIFDFGKVLCNYDTDIFLKKLQDDTGKDISLLRDLIYSTDITERADKGVITEQEFYDEVRQNCGLNLGQKDFINAFNQVFTPIEPVHELIRKLKGRYKLGLLSNASEWIFESEIRTLDIFPLFDAVTISYELKCLKPEAEIFHDMLDKLGRTPQECIFIDDRPENIEAADELGMKGIVFEDENKLNSELNRVLGKSAKDS